MSADADSDPMPYPGWENPLYGGIMKTSVTLDQAGRVVLPKTLDGLQLCPGDILDVSVGGEEVRLRARRSSPMHWQQGIYVFSALIPGHRIDSPGVARHP